VSGEEGATARFGEGARYVGDDPEMLSLAIEAAFDYRGDVTLLLDRAEEVQGYLSNRNLKPPDPYVEIFPSDGSPLLRIPCRAIRGVAFTGRDTASGKSWEAWVKKYKAKREAEARGEAPAG
jgi:hypothetical protein